MGSNCKANSGAVTRTRTGPNVIGLGVPCHMMLVLQTPQQGPGMRTAFKRVKNLMTTTATSTAFPPAVWLAAGLMAGTSTNALADDPIMMPLVHLNQNPDTREYSRLGVWVGINGSAPRLYMFDTGSDQFNGQVDPKANVRPVSEAQVYAYGDGTYGNLVQQVEADKLSYHPSKDESSVFDSSSKHYLGRTVDIIYTKNSSQLNDDVKLSNEPVRDGTGKILTDSNGNPYFADLNARKKIEIGSPAESDGTFGTFGAGDFIYKSSANSNAVGGVTTSGYVVAANANLDGATTPGCAPCNIINLNPNLRAQFASLIPWGTNNDGSGSERPNFPGSGAHASNQYEGNYEYTFKFTVNGVRKTVTINGPILLDTGTPNAVYLSQTEAIEKLKAAGLDIKENNDRDPNNGIIDGFSVQKRGDGESFFEFKNIKLSRLSGEDKGSGLILGLPFFHNNSVIYDLENQATGYSPYFVSANNFTTDAAGVDAFQLNRVTAQTGSEGWLGLAGVVSGSGALTLDPKTNVRMTNTNTYTGATYIEDDALLFLAGMGSIEQSAKVVVNGTLNISQHGNGNPYWGISDAYNDTRIRSLSGTGAVKLGNRTLVLTAANGTFSGSIHDLDSQNNNIGGALSIVGGLQTLSGKNDFSGMTTVGPGAALLLASTGSISHDAITFGLLENDGRIDGVAEASKGGVVAGAGSFGAVNVTAGGVVEPGSALDPSRSVDTLTVTGDFAQQAGSLYNAGLGKSSDLIDVNGNAVIDSGSHIQLLRQGTPSIDVRYTLLSAAGGVSGTYGGLTGALAADAPFVDFELVYDANNVYLDTSRTGTTFANVASTFNQRSVAAAAEALGAGNVIQDNILFLTTPEARSAFDQLSGEIHASIPGVLIEDSHFVRDAAGDRIRAAFDGVAASTVPIMAYGPDGPELVPATSENFAVWGRGFGAWGHLDADGNAARLERSTGGLLTGGDAAVGESWRLGLITGYSHTSFHVDDRASSGSSENYHLGLYAGTQHGNLGFRSGFAYTWHRIETDRSVMFPGFADSLSADYNAGTFQAFGELGYRIDTASAAFEPYANLAYVKFDADGFSEEGGAAALSSSNLSSNTTFTTLGLRASTELTFGTVNATARGGLGWRHAFGDVRPETGVGFAGNSSFVIEGVPIARNSALLEAGLDLNLSGRATLGVAYQGQIASDAQEHGFNARLGVNF